MEEKTKMEYLTVNPTQSDSVIVVPGIQLVAEFMKFVIWSATPRQFREIETQKEFAESVGVCEDTLCDWKKRSEFLILRAQNMKDWLKERVPDALGGLYMKVSGDKATAKDVEMFLKLAGVEIINKKINRKK